MTKLYNVDINETLTALDCCTSLEGCTNCPFAKYKNTCQRDLMYAAMQAIQQQQHYINNLETTVSELSTEREVFLARISDFENGTATKV